jgi:hypothetical protein
MKLRTASFFVLICFSQLTFGQKQLPVVKATSETVDIREDNKLYKGKWTIRPELNPDPYITSSKKITFYTNIDSISFNIDSSVESYDFVILLNDKDSAYTQIKYRYEISYLEKLQKGEKYDYFDTRFVPKFEYQSMDDPNLVRIRQELKLDSIAGQGNEISKILNLMHWVHYVVRHDGNSNNPESMNAIDLINVCKVENRGVNCRMMATILNECYLALGIKSRFVTCMPREIDFNDCHVINMVYSNDLEKWIWIDPSFDAYVMNEKGELLGIEEVRERLINNQPLILNPDANWNREMSYTKEYYLENYMTKNLYRFESHIVSEYNSETYADDKPITFVELLPLDGLEQTPQKREWTNSAGVPGYYYKTNNPNLFWTKP